MNREPDSVILTSVIAAFKELPISLAEVLRGDFSALELSEFTIEKQPQNS